MCEFKQASPTGPNELIRDCNVTVSMKIWQLKDNFSCPYLFILDISEIHRTMNNVQNLCDTRSNATKLYHLLTKPLYSQISQTTGEKGPESHWNKNTNCCKIGSNATTWSVFIPHKSNIPFQVVIQRTKEKKILTIIIRTKDNNSYKARLNAIKSNVICIISHQGHEKISNEDKEKSRKLCFIRKGQWCLQI